MPVAPFMWTGGVSNNRRDNSANTVIPVRVGFRDLDGNYVNPVNPTGRYLRDGKVVQGIQLLASTMAPDGTFPLSPVSTGIYSAAFMTTGMTPGLYVLETWGDIVWNTKTLTVRVGGTIELGEVSMLQYYITRLRIRLMDERPNLYRLDEPVPQWPAETLAACLMESLSHINNRGPRITYEAFETVGEDLIVTGGMIYALESRARLESANAMQYTDGHSLNIDRGPRYLAMAQQLRNGWDQTIESWKKATPPRPIGEKSQQLPFRIFRIIGLLPNYQSYFEGLYA